MPFPGPSSSGDQVLASAVAATYRLPAAWFSGCTTGAPSQVDVDHPEPQEVLAKKPACSLVDNSSLGLRLPPSGSGCLLPGGWSAAG